MLKQMIDRIWSGGNSPHDSEIYAQIHSELSSGLKDPGLWTKAMAVSDGNANKTMSRYIEMRANTLRQERKKPLTQEPVPRSAKPEVKNKGCGALIGFIIIILLLVAVLLLILSYKERLRAVSASPLAQSQNAYAPSSYDKLVTSYERQYPQINPDSPHFDKRLTDQIANRMSTYRASGHSADDALKLAVRDFFSQNASQSKSPDSSNKSRRKTSGSSTASQGCVIKPVMTDEDYLRCGITPPGAR